MAEEHILGEIANESHYNPNAVAPTIDAFYTAATAMAGDNGIITVTPLGKVGSPKRRFGSTSAIIQVKDIITDSQETILGRAIAPVGTPQWAQDMVVWGDAIRDPAWTGRILEELCHLQYSPIHITGIAFKPTS